MIRAIVLAHARYLAAFPSLHSSANNHRIAEGLGLFVAGILLPDLAEARAWLDEGRRIIEAEATRQILADGVGAEQSPTYQAFSMEMTALAARLAADLHVPLDPRVTERLLRGAEYLSWLSDQNGFVPAIGDDDEGRVIAQPPDHEPRYVASIVAAVAGLAKSAHLPVPPHDPHLRDAVFDSPPSSSPENIGLRVFEEGGVSVANETLLGRHVHLVFDHGPLGLMPLAAHGHADALAIWLTIDGEPVFIDAGTYRYFSGGETRSALRESLAHNSLVIDGVTQSRIATAFSWKTSATARLVRATRGPAWSVEGEHDGYCKTFGVRHVRRIRRTETGFFIDDQLLRRTRPPDSPLGNTRRLAVTLRFLCDPRVAIALDGNDVMIGGRHDSLCRIAPPPGFVAEIAETMHSKRFGHLAPTRQIIFAGALSNEMATTHIAIAGPARPPVYPGEPAVAASDPQSDMREKAWH
jgi:Heparinase II/III-like protein/Heparinase II/III N-terminus